MERIMQASFNGDPNLGIFGFATDRYCILGPRLSSQKRIEAVLGTKSYVCPVFGTEISGIFIAGNSSGMIVPSSLEDEEIAVLEKVAEVLKMKTKYTAIGNLVLINDHGCMVSRLIKEEKERIEKFFGIECRVFESNVGVIGSCALANNTGCIAHPGFGEGELKQVEKCLKVDCQHGTANFGSPFVGSCSIANSRGLVASEQSTGIEVSRMEEILFGAENQG